MSRLILDDALNPGTEPFADAAGANAYVIEVHDRTAGIVARDGRGFRFFSSERLFDTLDGLRFGSAREAERAARALMRERGSSGRRPLFAAI